MTEAINMEIENLRSANQRVSDMLSLPPEELLDAYKKTSCASDEYSGR